MSLTDPIADMIIRINNAQRALHAETSMPASKLKCAIAEVLKSEGYISDYAMTTEGAKSTLKVVLKYYRSKPVIRDIKRASKPSLRVYKAVKELPQVAGGYGTAIVSTPKGVMSALQARKLGVGGEIICYVW